VQTAVAFDCVMTHENVHWRPSPFPQLEVTHDDPASGTVTGQAGAMLLVPIPDHVPLSQTKTLAHSTD
jgi:uncharacterized protein involved in type VI secretion and phage assembly